MTKCIGRFLALALTAAALACSSDHSNGPSGTCHPTVQSSPDPTGAESYCVEFFDAVCDRGFRDCVTQLGLSSYFANVTDCKAAFAADCAAQDHSSEWLDPVCGDACVAFVRGCSCSAFTGSEPQACAAATGSFPPTCIATISPGTISDTIVIGDPVYDGGHSRTYCITFSAGQSVVIETAAPLAGTPINDTVLYLLGPSGAEIGYDDDNGDGLYSRIATTIATSGVHRVVVRGYSSGYVGGFRLTVTTL